MLYTCAIKGKVVTNCKILIGTIWGIKNLNKKEVIFVRNR
ncbi:hypothetical protein DFR64_2430 [Pelolinea submarina]|uniref:Uncharacterized protein n=1 Tax=Pelolinea submarina TaxID=913107 RepID=A0A3E0AEG3_9CHLR|nr:hypothetical protein DFR64_2430 [Pelolinea submarina]